MRLARQRNLLGLGARCPRRGSNMAEYAIEKARATGTTFALHLFLLQLL